MGCLDYSCTAFEPGSLQPRKRIVCVAPTLPAYMMTEISRICAEIWLRLLPVTNALKVVRRPSKHGVHCIHLLFVYTYSACAALGRDSYYGTTKATVLFLILWIIRRDILCSHVSCTCNRDGRAFNERLLARAEQCSDQNYRAQLLSLPRTRGVPSSAPGHKK